MNQHTRHPKKFTRSRCWPGLLALVLFVLQPLLLSLNCGPVSAHSHFEGQSPHHVHTDDAAHDHHHTSLHNAAHHNAAHHNAAHYVEQNHEHHSDADAFSHNDHAAHSHAAHSHVAHNHAVPSVAFHSLSVSPDHHHHVCCPSSDAPMVLASLPTRLGASESYSVPVSHAAIVVPSFRLDVLAEIPIRAGPPELSPLRSLFLRNTLLGRAPPLAS